MKGNHNEVITGKIKIVIVNHPQIKGKYNYSLKTFFKKISLENKILLSL